MAWTIPTGYIYYDYSASKYYTAGQSAPTLGDEDQVLNVSSSSQAANATLLYHYGANSLGGSFEAVLRPTEAGSSVSISLDTIQGKQVRKVTISDDKKSNLKSITRFPMYMRYILMNGANNLISIPSSFPSLIEYINFNNCSSLTAVPDIPATPENPLGDTLIKFLGCTNLEGRIRIDANPQTYAYMFYGTTKPIILYGKGNLIPLAKTANNKNVYVNIINRSRIVL